MLAGKSLTAQAVGIPRRAGRFAAQTRFRSLWSCGQDRVLNDSEIRQGGFEPKLDRFIDALELPAAAGNISPDRQLDVAR